MIFGWIKRIALAVALFAVTLISVFSFGKRAGRSDAALKDAKEYAKTRKRIDNAQGSSGDTSRDREWLRDYGDK